MVDVGADKTMAMVRVSNRDASVSSDYAGMGVGTLVARAIVEAHGGILDRDRENANMIHHIIRLPLMEAANG
jgi:nitrogen-specific signal transduction histidine kinase